MFKQFVPEKWEVLPQLRCRTGAKRIKCTEMPGKLTISPLQKGRKSKYKTEPCQAYLYTWHVYPSILLSACNPPTSNLSTYT